mgnify:CR=1 FL=1
MATRTNRVKMHFTSMRQADVPHARNGKHKEIVTRILSDLDQIEKGFFGAPRMNHVKGHLLTGHHPQPFQGIFTVPGGFINITNPCLTRLRGDQRVVWIDRQGHPIQDLLNGA